MNLYILLKVIQGEVYIRDYVGIYNDYTEAYIQALNMSQKPESTTEKDIRNNVCFLLPGSVCSCGRNHFTIEYIKLTLVK